MNDNIDINTTIDTLKQLPANENPFYGVVHKLVAATQLIPRDANWVRRYSTILGHVAGALHESPDVAMGLLDDAVNILVGCWGLNPLPQPVESTLSSFEALQLNPEGTDG